MHPVTWNCLIDKHKKLITMAVMFSLSAQRVVCMIKLLIQITIINIIKPLGLEPLFIDLQMKGSHHTKLFKPTWILLHPKHLCSHTHLTLVCLWQESQISC